MPRIPLCDLRRAVEELSALRGEHLDNLYQFDARAFLLRFSPGKASMIVDLHPGRARALVTDAPPEPPEAPPVFCQILRRHLRGGVFLGAMLLAEDRVIGLDFRVEGAPLRLVVEALPRHANLLLLDTKGEILRLLDGEAGKRRGNSVGGAYHLPSPPKSVTGEASLLPADLPPGPFAANHFLERLHREAEPAAEPSGSRKEVERTLARLRRNLEAVKGDLRDLPDAEGLRRQGEVLLEHFPELRQGMKDFQGVPLDPKLNPQENVERIFEQARKALRAGPILRARQQELEGWIARAESGEWVPATAAQPAREGRPSPRLPYRTFLSADGMRILVGKGGADNDELTLRVAGPHDLFLHVRGTPGAHVVIPLGRDQAPPEQTLIDAASLALHYSKSRNAQTADVCFTRCKNVSKPRGGKPGLVQVTQEKVFRLRREPDRLARLLATAGAPE